MKKEKMNKAVRNIAKAMSTMLLAVLFISANTGSCHMIYEPKAPDALNRFKKLC